MARIVSMSSRTELVLNAGWRLAISQSQACATPSQASQLRDWLAAKAPGTTALALIQAGRSDVDAPTPLFSCDVWWRLDLVATGPQILEFCGLAGLAEIWLDETLLSTSCSMFVERQVEVTLKGDNTLWLCFRAMTQLLERKLPRARWRPRMISRQGLRGVRTTLLGQMPGWTPSVDAIGPWRKISCITPTTLRVIKSQIQAQLIGQTGRLVARILLEGEQSAPVLHCAGFSTVLQRDDYGAYVGALDIADVAAWWPHTHGDQPLYPVSLAIDGAELDLGRTGFRTIAVDRGPDGDGFGVWVNGAPIFCRGACWTSHDVVGLAGDREAYEPWLRLAQEGGMNMLRMSGTGVYETTAFFDLCDELGIMVWQDFMFANFDYPIADPNFRDLVEEEIEQFLDRVQLSPSLTVLCGGSEVHQQATMMGVRPENTASALFDEILPAAAQLWRPDAIYVVNSPYGGPLPFVNNVGVSHYFGVGAYCRPMEDSRRAGVRFAAEALAFANIPSSSTLQEALGSAPYGSPAWKARTPRDLGAEWDFEDVRDHYLGQLYGLDVAVLRDENPQLYLDLSRAVTGQVMAATYAEWRRCGSTCQGALIWTFQDLWPGAGWGVIDSLCEPKSAWYALKRAFGPLHLAMTDEGCNGLSVHLINETAQALALEVEITCLRDGRTPVVSARRSVEIGARSQLELSSFEIIGAFFDVNFAYRFGQIGHDAVVARLRRRGLPEVLAETIYYPPHANHPYDGKILTKTSPTQEGAWLLELQTDRLTRNIHLEVSGFRPDDNDFDLAPGTTKRVLLGPGKGVKASPAPRGGVFAPGGILLAQIDVSSAGTSPGPPLPLSV